MTGKGTMRPFSPEFALLCVCVICFVKRKCVLVWACGEEKDQRSLGCRVWRVSQMQPHTLPWGWACQAQVSGTRWRPTVKGCEGAWGGLHLLREALAPLKPRRSPIPWPGSSNRLLAWALASGRDQLHIFF